MHFFRPQKKKICSPYDPIAMPKYLLLNLVIGFRV
jgi:hypothetical protein